ncbi:MAG: hypothetical protein LBV34_25975, partial [Nocardiopsaceae bacterium]|nr:hypothetical protein [Nocardiopsaceae bacterium]
MAGGTACSVLDVEVVDVSESDLGESCGAGAVVLEVDLLESLGDDRALVLITEALLLGLKEALGIGGGEVEGEAAEAAIVGGADGGGGAACAIEARVCRGCGRESPQVVVMGSSVPGRGAARRGSYGVTG